MTSRERWEAFKSACGETPLEYVTRWANDEALKQANEIILAMIAETEAAALAARQETP